MSSCSPSPLAMSVSPLPSSQKRILPPKPMSIPKEPHFNHNFSATKKLLAGVDLVTDLLGVTLGPKGRNVVLQNKYGPPKIVNDGETVLKEVELEDPLENVGVKLVRQAGAKTNDLAGDGSTTSIVLAKGLIAEGVKVLSVGMNPVQIARGIEKTAKALVSELKLISREIEDHEIAYVAAVSAGNDHSIGNMISDALRKLLLVDKKITDPREMFKVLDGAVKEKYPLLVIAEGVEQEVLALMIRNKLKGVFKVAAIKAPSFGEGKSHFFDDLAILTGGKVVHNEMGLTLEKAGKEVLVVPQAAIEEGVVVGGGCTLLRLSTKVDSIKESLDNDEQKVVRCCLENAASVAKTFLTSDVVVVEVNQPKPVRVKIPPLPYRVMSRPGMTL
ncbi:hypothetical protein J5N97_004918 [Dioscorea zingiberensis]|uniref:Uncharacterized protein n=1 Tax=Dioscorea zingiberensis TaxID=325984 RepID=A0A9D5D9C2_9LILI|nr:hypothetical protein J5N97_004918 [Dioscorea zingiberensis]